MAIRNGEDFVRIFSRSERIITDINDFSYLKGNIFEQLKRKSQGEGAEVNGNEEFIKVWVRKWEYSEWSEEFRIFYN